METMQLDYLKNGLFKKNVSPIIYLPKPKTTLPQNHFLKPLKGKEKRVLNDNDFGEKIDGLAPIASFCKHYEGILEKIPTEKNDMHFTTNKSGGMCLLICQ